MFQLVKKIYRVWRSPIWRAAKRAVSDVNDMLGLRTQAQSEPTTSFCPRCGQVPDGDRRMDEARQRAMSMLVGIPVSRHELDMCISVAYWLRKGL